MITVLSVFGTRPEAIKMAPVIRALEARSDSFRSVVCVTGQHREMLDSVLNLFDIVPDHDLAVMARAQSLASLTGSVLAGLDPVLEATRPDWVLVQGDTTTAMAASLGAFYRRIQIGHIEAGLRTNDRWRPFPEEINRRITSVVADLHLAPTVWAAGNLRREGIAEGQIAVTGNTVIDAIRMTTGLPFDPARGGLERLATNGRRLVLVTAHRRESFGRGIEEICGALRDLAGRGDIEIVYPVHLNPEVAGPVRAALDGIANITLLRPVEYREMVWLLERCAIVLTDSGGLQEEAPGLGKPVLVLRDTTERPEGVDAGVVRLVGTDRARIVAEATRLLDDAVAYKEMARAISPYGDGHAGERIARLLAPDHLSTVDDQLASPIAPSERAERPLRVGAT